MGPPLNTCSTTPWFFMSISRHFVLAVFMLLTVSLIPFTGSAAEPLYQQIDKLIAARHENFSSFVSSDTSDTAFLRRLYLDLTGSVPPLKVTKAFIASTDPDKRTLVVNQLLDSPEYANNMQRVFDVILMERRGDKVISDEPWKEYLRKSFADNKPLSDMVGEMLGADGADESLRPAAKFYLDRGGETNLLTRDIGRLFLGVNLQCAQCHDHPLVLDYFQEDYYGIFAFLNRSYLFTDKAKKVFFAEKAEGDVSFVSVFDPDKKEYKTGPRLPGLEVIKEPTFEKGEEYQVKPEDGIRPIPKYSRRAELARLLPSKQNVLFKRNMANRIWALLMGRGIVHPLDFHHEDNPPSHPELLNVLAEQFATSNFDIKSLLRQIALSQTYQRSSLPSENLPSEKETFAVALLKPLSAEQLAMSMMQVTGYRDFQKASLKDPTDKTALDKIQQKNINTFVSIFGSAEGVPEDGIQPTMNQALFLSNGALVRSWLQPKPGNLIDQIYQISDPEQLAKELFLSVLIRLPDEEEKLQVTAYLDQANDEGRTAALQELAWALITSTEFRFNH